MPELPEVETVRRGLVPFMEGAEIVRAEAFRPDLRFPFPPGFPGSLAGVRIGSLDRRGKYLVAALTGGVSLIAHLGMSGRFLVDKTPMAGDAFYRTTDAETGEGANAHVHVAFHLRPRNGAAVRIDYADPRRFGFMDLVPTATLETCRHFRGMGPEPLGADFTADTLRARLEGKRTPLKAALLDQRVVAGLGNIYVCEALFRAGLSPRRQARTVGRARALRLHSAIRETLLAAIEAGGSTLRDFASADGSAGYFQHAFEVYDRESAPCPACGQAIVRIVQSGRSTFYCGRCQR